MTGGCFFFQAEDGIRDIGVTGVQTCALPISGTVNDIEGFARAASNVVSIVDAVSGLGACELRTDEWGVDVVVAGSQKARSEERRVGKECRSRWSPYHSKKKNIQIY